MGTITDKLDYLNNTKSKLKNEINKIGGNITNETTFRDYVSNINNIYDKLPKVEGSGSDITLSDTEDALLSLTPEGYASQGILPSDYMQVEYIESTGEQYINTNYIPNENTRIIAKTTFNIGSLFGVVDGEQIKSLVLAGAKGSNTWAEYARFFSTGGVRIPYNFINTAENTVYEIEMTNSEAKIILNNKSYIANYTRENQNITTPLYIFARKINDRTESPTQRKLYNFKIYNSNVLVRDYIPCYRKLDGEIGLYDLVNNIFYTNQGTGSFLHGDVIPSPDYPQPIKGVTGEQNVEISEKNLFDKDNANVIDGYISAGNTTLLSNGSTNKLIWINIKNSTTYTISKKVFSSSSRFGIATSVEEPATGISISNAIRENGSNYLTVTSGQNDNYLIVYVWTNNSTYTLEEALDTVQIEKGSTATSFEPYYTPQNYPLSLGNIELAKIGDYKDYIFKNVVGSPHYNANLDLNGWYKFKKIYKYIVTGNEDFSNSYGTNLFNCCYLFNDAEFIVGFGLSNYYKYNSVQSGINAHTINGEFVLQKDSYGCHLFFKNTNFDNASNFKLDLQEKYNNGNPVIVMFPLVTPTYEKITDTTLISQLENINNNARSYKDTTIIECSSASEENETLQVSTVALKDLDLLTAIENTETLTTNSASNISTNELTNLNSIEEIESEVSE